MIYLYAITDSLRLPPGARGLEDAPLEILEVGGVCGVYSTHDQLDAAPLPPLLWRHDQVVEQLMDLGAVLPLRFGAELAGPEELRSTLTGQGARFRRLLDRVRGCVELAVRVGVEPAAEGSVSNGAEYMRLRLADQRVRQAAADRVLSPLRELANASSRGKARASSETVSESYLVAREAVKPFVDRVTELQARNQSLSLSCTGPWGPYSFVDEAGS